MTKQDILRENTSENSFPYPFIISILTEMPCINSLFILFFYLFFHSLFKSSERERKIFMPKIIEQVLCPQTSNRKP